MKKKTKPIAYNYRIVSDIKKKMNAAYIPILPILLFHHEDFSCIHDIFDIDYSPCGCFIFQVYSVVDEMFLAGEIRETSQTKVLKQLLMLSSLE